MPVLTHRFERYLVLNAFMHARVFVCSNAGLVSFVHECQRRRCDLCRWLASRPLPTMTSLSSAAALAATLPQSKLANWA